MKMSSPAFGLVSGFSTSLGLLPHIATLGLLLMIGIPPRSVTSLIVFTIGAKALGEWFFWNHCKRRMDSEPRLKNWRLVVNDSLLSQPNVIVGLLMMLLDAFMDVALVNIALKTSLPPIWVFLALLGCQALASPIQGGLSDIVSQKKSLLFATIVGMIAASAVAEISVEGKVGETSMYSPLSLLCISSFSADVQMLIILCGKGLLANLTVISRAAIAKVIKIETIEKFSRV